MVNNAVLQHDQYILDPGQDLEVGLDGYLARTVRIDNLSNSWLFVESSAQRYVRPLCLGWWTQLIPAQSAIKVSAVDAPAGGIQSQNTGGKVLVDVYEQSMGFGGDADGTLAGVNIPLGQDCLTITALQTTDPTPDTVLATQLLAAPGVGLRYRVYGMSVRKQRAIASVLLANLWVNFNNTIAGTGFINLGVGANQTADHEWLGGNGCNVANNSPISITSRCDIASLQYGLTLAYNIEAAN